MFVSASSIHSRSVFRKDTAPHSSRPPKRSRSDCFSPNISNASTIIPFTRLPNRASSASTILSARVRSRHRTHRDRRSSAEATVFLRTFRMQVRSSRLRDSRTAPLQLQQSFRRVSDLGTALIETVEAQPKRLFFSEHFECKYDHPVYATPEPRLFSFNNPFGACPTCQGFGNTIGLDLDLVIPNPGLSLKDGAIEPWTKPQHEWAMQELKQFCRAEKISMTVPFNQLSRSDQQAIIEGRGDFGGVRGFFEWLETKKYKLHVRVFLSKYRGYTLCPDCGGGRLRQEARDVKISGSTLPEICSLSIKDADEFFDKLELSTEQTAIADRILFEVRRRLRFLVEIGLDYLSLDRLASTLSGGEAQRIQLATNLGSSLVGALYVLDEPSIGLHP